MEADKPRTEASQATEETILSYLFPKSFKCLVCDNEFMDFIIRKSRLRVTNVDTDFMTKYKDVDPNQYEVLFCSHCGYAALHSHFDKITAKQQQLIRKEISPKHKPLEFPVPLKLEHVILRYKQALLCATVIGAKASNKAFISLKLSWILRNMGVQRELELRFLRYAFEGLKEAFTTERFPLGNMDEMTAQYVIADLARRLGEPSEAMRWVGDVVVAKGIPSGLKERAVALKNLIREGKTN